jgi:hypothetical protein
MVRAVILGIGMMIRHLLLGSLTTFGLLVLPANAADALLVKVSINFGPTIVGPDNGTLTITANPGDLLVITWALGTDTDIDVYRGLVGGVDGTEISRFVGSALELTGQGFDPGGNPNAPSIGEFAYDAWSDGAPIGFAANDGELWRIEYTVTTPVTDAFTDMTYTIGPGGCITFLNPSFYCPGTSATEAVSASLRINAVPEPATFLLLVSGLAGAAGSNRKR